MYKNYMYKNYAVYLGQLQCIKLYWVSYHIQSIKIILAKLSYRQSKNKFNLIIILD